MTYRRLLFCLALLCFVGALAAMFFLPPRVATHNDNQSTSQFTETRSLTLASYYWSASSQTDTITIGTEPYTEYYVRTYALEPWVLGGMLLAFSTIRKKRQTL